MLGAKEVHSIAPFDLNDLKALSKSISKYSQRNLAFQPTLINSYQRSYYGTSDGHFRMTIDWKLRYFSMLNARQFTRYNISDEATILELKYAAALDQKADDIFQSIPFRFSKSSKYVSGMNLVVGG